MDLSPIKNMREASDYVRQMPRDKRIVVFGDEDIDGVASVIIISEALKRIGFSEVKSMFCLYEQEGHGFSLSALRSMESFAPELIFLVDLGISNYEAVAEAHHRGIKVIIIDHHEPLSEQLPPADFIIDPKQPGDGHGFKQLAAAGLCYHFSRWLLGDDPDLDVLDGRFAELAGLATLADMMPLEEDNIPLVDRFFQNLPHTTNLTLGFLLDRYLAEGATLKESVSRMIGTLSASRVNSRRQAESFILLSQSRSSDIAKKIGVLEKRVREHIAAREMIVHEAEQRLAEEGLSGIIFLGDENWPRRSLASAAARLSDLHQRPVFLYHQEERTSRGSVRSPEEFDCVVLMKSCADRFVNYGGHPMAAGFEVKNEELQKLRLCLLDNFHKIYG